MRILWEAASPDTTSGYVHSDWQERLNPETRAVFIWKLQDSSPEAGDCQAGSWLDLSRRLLKRADLEGR